MVKNSDVFQIRNNVHISVVDNFGNLKNEFEVHNKCTRTMVVGLLKHLLGAFDPNKHGQIQESNVKYIPHYFSVGFGGTTVNDSVFEIDPNTPRDDEGNLVPLLSSDWNQDVSYTSTTLEKEFGDLDKGTHRYERPKIKAAKTTISNREDIFPDMDGIYYYCEIGPNALNPQFNGNKVFITELGLFAGNVIGTDDLLAYVKLGNVQVDDGQGGTTLHTNTVWLSSDDTLIIHWVITIAAIGQDTRFAIPFIEDGTEENTEPTPVTQDILVVPNKNIEIYNLIENE